MKYVTIATDISCDQKYKITTWACYIRHSGGVIKQTGQFKKFIKGTAKAETYALINALTIARNNVPDWNESKVIIYNEVEHALDPVMTKAGNTRLKDADRAEAIRTIAIPILKEALDWERRKIKAHYRNWETSDNPVKYAINRWCDLNSREAMRKIRGEKKRELRSK